MTRKRKKISKQQSPAKNLPPNQMTKTTYVPDLGNLKTACKLFNDEKKDGTSKVTLTIIKQGTKHKKRAPTEDKKE
eukprot:8333687-Ditylum_brightwellii.AAC.1